MTRFFVEPAELQPDFLVLTGEATMADVETADVVPTCIYDSLFDISRYL